MPVTICGILLLLPELAFADPISTGFVFVTGLTFLAPLAVLAEGFVLSRCLSLKYKRVLMAVLWANLFSLLAGIPLQIIYSYFYPVIAPKELSEYFSFYPWIAALGSLIYFLVIIIVEFQVILKWCARKHHNFQKSIIFFAVTLANISTYIVLAPAYYFATKPTHNVQQFTGNSLWATNPKTKVIYIDSATQYLHSIDLDGRNSTVLVPHKVKDYLLANNLKHCVFRSEQNHLYCYDLIAKRNTMISTLANKYVMNEVAVSPGGDKIAFLKWIGVNHPFKLMIYEISANKLVETDFNVSKDTEDTVVGWSAREDTLYVKALHARSVTRIILKENGITEKLRIDNPEKLEINPDYGRNSSRRWHEGNDWGASYPYDRCGAREASASRDLEHTLTISEYKLPILQYADNPGILHLGNRPIGDVLFLPGCGECIFDDHKAIYLLDIDDKRIGKIANGHRFILISEKYSKLPLFSENQ